MCYLFLFCEILWTESVGLASWPVYLLLVFTQLWDGIAFHGRGFFPDQFHPGDPQALVAAIEAFVGLLIEVTFIATLTQRLFGK